LQQNEVRNFVTKTPSDAMIMIEANKPVEEAIKILSENKILSLPVIDPTTKQILGLVDMLDIVCHVVSVVPDSSLLKGLDYKSLDSIGKAITKEPIMNIIDKSGRNPFTPIHENSPSSIAALLLATGIHRVPIYNSEGEIVSMLSQSDVIRLVNAWLPLGDMKQISTKKAKDLGLGIKSVISINQSECVLMALSLISKHGVSAVAVVTDDGKLAGNFSVSDLRGISMSSWSEFMLPITNYLEKYGRDSLKPIHVFAEVTLAQAMNEIVKSKVHRVWVVDTALKPVSVISMTDIMIMVRDFCV